LLPCLNHGNEKRSRSFKGNRHIKISSEHFTLDDFINQHSSKKRSKANAVPSMFPWNKEKQKKVQPVKRSALEKLDQGRAKEEATDTHVDEICRKVSSAIGFFRRIRPLTSESNAIPVNNTQIQPQFDDCTFVWDMLCNQLSN
ncbi:hypothetical protein pdam_00004632, partial [Pocillopora damicornis]